MERSVIVVKKMTLAVLASIMLLAVGFAAVSTSLFFNGVIALGEEEDFKIVFTSAELDSKKILESIDENKQIINFSTKTFSAINDTTILDYEVANTSRNYDADVKVVCSSEESDSVEMSYVPKNIIVGAGMSEQGSITISLIKSVKDMSVNMTCSLVASPIERTSLGDEYVFDKGVMIPVNTITNESGSTTTEGYFWDYKANIKHVVFENNTIDRSNALYSFDVSLNQDKSVMSYLVPELTDSSKYTLYIQGEDKIILNQKCNNFFQDFVELEDIAGLEMVDTSIAKNMTAMFYNCSKLASLDVSHFNTGNVTSMKSLFYGCNSLTSLDLSSFDTSSVINMVAMFRYCNNLNELDLSNFDTGNVTDMSWMFYGCVNLASLNVSNFNTKMVTNMRAMFYECSSLTELDLSSFYAAEGSITWDMFGESKKLLTIDLSNFDFFNITNAIGMFYNTSDKTKVLVRDAQMQNKVLKDLPTNGTTFRTIPESWTAANVIIKS